MFQVGRSVANFIKLTVQKFKVNLKKVRLVGFSLGAHIAGFAGKSLNGKVASIIGKIVGQINVVLDSKLTF